MQKQQTKSVRSSSCRCVPVCACVCVRACVRVMCVKLKKKIYIIYIIYTYIVCLCVRVCMCVMRVCVFEYTCIYRVSGSLYLTIREQKRRIALDKKVLYRFAIFFSVHLIALSCKMRATKFVDIFLKKQLFKKLQNGTRFFCLVANGTIPAQER